MRPYQKQLDELISQLEYKPKLLLHSCCGPCSSYCIEYLSQFFEITVFFYNPNIHPEQEYLKRLETQRRLVDRMGLAELAVGVYDDDRYFECVRGLEKEPEGGQRCEKCFEMRLKATAKAAGDYDYFCSTLTVSPHKNAELINRLGEQIGQKYGVKWLPSDFKKREGYKRSIMLSKQYHLYRQNYCGCVFSKSK